MNIGILGVGSVFGAYMRGLRAVAGLPVLRLASRDPERARAAAEAAGVPRWGGLDDFCADDDVELVVNLTPPAAHAGTTLRLLEAGKHVFVEKPFAPDVAAAQRIIDAAASADRLLGCAPDVFLGPAGQTARAALDAGMIGRPFAATSFVRSSRVETWHPDPAGYFGPLGGPVLDWGPYHVALLVNLLGPVRSVMAAGVRARDEVAVSAPGRTGDVVPVAVDTHVSAVLEFPGPCLVTAMYSFDVWETTLPHLEIYGTEGTLRLPDPTRLHGTVEFRARGADAWTALPAVMPRLLRGELREFRGLGVAEMAGRLAGGGEHRTDAALGLHVLDVLTALGECSMDSGSRKIRSTVARPAAMELE
ncbi:Gfo/Idh/MocA family protein [Tomitella cavernea]|uniref:Gfo/Idh/MocA family oxidoreductase n=1 Tax=Tomitella cavernea TaxID=1387982 RepID=A0ABP9CPJ3_9ACTN|nr:Gfo/Idh/MocA family oxidoreductase [Tomitella cavernea]